MTTSYTSKQLRVTFILAGANAKFPGTGNNTLILTNLRMASKTQGVSRQATQLDLKVMGMKPEDMNALTVAWANPPVVLDHLVILEANDGNGWVQVFKGTITEGQPQFTAQPDVYFHCLASVGYFQKIAAAPPTSYPFTVDIGVAAGDIIQAMGFKYVDGGATGVLSNPYFTGTLYDQLAQACAAANADFYMQGDTVLVTPRGLPRQNQPAVVLNKGTGLIGYPVFERAGLNVMAVWNSAFQTGTPIQLTSSIPSANGRWYPFALTHALDCNLPKGRWDSQLQCLKVST